MKRVGPLPRAVLALASSACLGFAVQSPAAAPHAQLRLTDGALTMSNSKAGAAILSATGLSPGAVAAGSVTIGNSGSVSGDFSLSSFDVTDVPGEGGGLLSTALTVTILDVTDPAAPRKVYTGSLGAMTPRQLGTFEPGSERTYSFSAGLAAGGRFDSVQGGAVSVGYRWTATESAAGSDGTPITTTAPPPPPTPTNTTPTDTPPTVTPPPPGLAPFKLALTGPRSWSARSRRGPAVTARCTRSCSLRATVKVSGMSRRGLALKVRSKPMASAAGRATRFEIVVAKSSRKKVRSALAGHHRVVLAVSVKASDQHKLKASGRKLIRVKR